MKKIIAIVAGGYSREYDVSLRSAQGLDRFIDRTKYDVYHVLLTRYEWSVRLPDGSMQPIDRNNFSFSYNGKTVTFDFAYITVHGTPGEDGRLQGYFDMLQLPYSSCGTLVYAVSERTGGEGARCSSNPPRTNLADRNHCGTTRTAGLCKAE